MFNRGRCRRLFFSFRDVVVFGRLEALQPSVTWPGPLPELNPIWTQSLGTWFTQIASLLQLSNQLIGDFLDGLAS